MAQHFDTQKLADRLETGISDIGGRACLYAPEYRLRVPICGLASTALHYSLEEAGVASQLRINRPEFEFDPELAHVYIEITDEEPTIVDPTYSQVMHYVGLTPHYDRRLSHSAYPEEKIAVFPVSKREELAAGLGASMLAFRTAHPDARIPSGISMPELPISAEVLGKLWDPAYAEVYVPDPDMSQFARELSTRL